jgi:hypothetical protein
MASQLGQDRWVARTLGERRDGTFLDIGAGDPVDISNTEELERVYGWRGVLCDIGTEDRLRAARLSEVRGDAFAVDWAAECRRLAPGGRIGYLSLDLEPPLLTLIALMRLPLATVRFDCLTVEHDAYRDGGVIRAAMRGILQACGYALVAPDRGLEVDGRFLEIEDWWVDPETVDVDAARRAAEC